MIASTQTFANRSQTNQRTRNIHSPDIPSDVAALMETAPIPVFLCDRNRAILHTNEAGNHLLATAPDCRQDRTMRPGNVLGCAHALGCAGGCGTSPYCGRCGLNMAMLDAHRGKTARNRCILPRDGAADLELRVFARPCTIDRQRLSVVAVEDQRSENRRRALERTFFHDVLNTASGLSMIAELLCESTRGDDPATIHLNRDAQAVIRRIQQEQDRARENNGTAEPESGKTQDRADAPDADDILEAIPVPLFLSDNAGRLMQANAASQPLRDTWLTSTGNGCRPRLASAIRRHSGHELETRIDGISRWFRVSSRRIRQNGRSLTAVAGVDTTFEHQRRDLERVFFHEVLNSAECLRGDVASLGCSAFAHDAEVAAFLPTLSELTHRLVEEIRAQKDYADAERGDYRPRVTNVDITPLLRDVANGYRAMAQDLSCSIAASPTDSLTSLRTDPVLLKRILGNLVKNALEASAPGDRVTISCRSADNSIHFAVHNPSVIPADIQAGIFRRTVSTKGEGRGTGTFAVKLFAEKYLHGRASFESAQEVGTTFRIQLPIAAAGSS